MHLRVLEIYMTILKKAFFFKVFIYPQFNSTPRYLCCLSINYKTKMNLYFLHIYYKYKQFFERIYRFSINTYSKSTRNNKYSSVFTPINIPKELLNILTAFTKTLRRSNFLVDISAIFIFMRSKCFVYSSNKSCKDKLSASKI
ncbi:hypothetical protein H311_02605 [Anncaliia algerae PRA109]|nr:hypothetical protein H311_02605 [Anncaliia algerae PRA109]